MKILNQREQNLKAKDDFLIIDKNISIKEFLVIFKKYVNSSSYLNKES